jgi:hypothetical protein
MANPNNLDDIIDVTVNIAEQGNNATSFSDPLLVATFATNPSFLTRVKKYEGNASTIKAALVNDGFAVTSPAYLMASRVVDQKGATKTIYIGRRDPGDASLVVALAAIKAEEDGAYHVFPDPDATTSNEHNAASAWVESEFFGVYHIQTDSAAIYNNSPGNLAATVLAAQRARTVIVWHEPEVASDYGPAILRSSLGTFNVPHNSTVELRIDGGATQTFTFLSTAATVTGTNPEDFVITDGDDMVFAIDDGEEQILTVELTQATVVSGNEEPYAMEPAMNLLVRRNGAAATNVLFSGTAGSDTTDAEPYAPAGASTTFSIDGGANQVVTWGAGDTTAALVKVALDAQLTGVVTTIVAGPAVKIESARYGSSSSVEIIANAGNALAEYGLAVADNVGTGFAAFLDAATAAEVAAEIDADTTNVVSVDDDGFVSVASNTEGTTSRIQITGGSANAVLGFDTNEVTGTGDFADGAAVSAAEMASWINENSFGVSSTAPATAVVMTSDTTGSASEIDFVSGSLLTTLGFTAGSTLGTGFAANAAAAEPSEVATLISATLTSGAASSASNRVVITSTSLGADASVEAVGGDALDVLFGESEFAAGTGVPQDYLGAAWIGYGSSIQLDRPGGNAGWDNAGNLVGVYADTIDKTQREVLHETLRVNTYEPRRPTRDEFHDGLICRNVNDLHRYIDQQISADWLDARTTEAIKDALDAASDARTKIPLTDVGIQGIGAIIVSIAQLSSTNGHTVFDDSAIDDNTPNDTGVFVPTLAELTEDMIDTRRPGGFRIVQRLQNQVQGAVVSITLTNVLAG